MKRSARKKQKEREKREKILFYTALAQVVIGFASLLVALLKEGLKAGSPAYLLNYTIKERGRIAWIN